MNTVLDKRETKIVIERSKFFSFAFPCRSLDEQDELLKEIKSKNLSASHICHAFALDFNGDIRYYSSDDGEPSGTAGGQILCALKENSLVNCLCVVVRYFGGVKLGIPGLSKAYKMGALSVLKDNIAELKLKSRCKIQCGYRDFNLIKAIAGIEEKDLIDLNFDNGVNFEIFLTEVQTKKVQEQFLNIDFKVLDKQYCI